MTLTRSLTLVAPLPRSLLRFIRLSDYMVSSLAPLAGDWVQSPVGTTLTIKSTNFGVQGVGVAVSQAVSLAAGTLHTELAGATTAVVVAPTSGTFDTTYAITVNSHVNTPIPIVVDESATTKWGDIGDWDVSGVKDFSFAFSKSRDEVGGTKITDGNLKAATFTAVSGMSKWITSAVTTLRGTFAYAADLDVDLGNWDVSSVDTMYVRIREGEGKTESKIAAPVGWY